MSLNRTERKQRIYQVYVAINTRSFRKQHTNPRITAWTRRRRMVIGLMNNFITEEIKSVGCSAVTGRKNAPGKTQYMKM